MRKLQIAIAGDSEDSALIESAATIVARRGAILLVQNTLFGEQVVLAAGKVSTMRYVSFDYPKAGGSLEARARFGTEVSAMEGLCLSADGAVLLGESELAAAMCRKLGKPLVKPAKPAECLEAVGDLLNQILSEIIRS